MCVIRTAESVVFTDWPPGPVARNTSISRSFGSRSTSTSSASGSTATVAALVWIRPWLSVAGTRCTRCGPPSYLKRAHAGSPLTTNVTSRKPPCSDGLLREHFELQAAALGESLVHAEEVSGPEVRFLAALGALDLDDDVAALVGIARQQELADLGRELLDDVRLLVDLRLQVLAHLVVGFGREQLVGVVETGRRFFPGAIRGDERLQLGVPASGVARGAPVARCEDPGKVGLQPLELALEFFELLEHDLEGTELGPARPVTYSRLLIRFSMPLGPSADCSAKVSSILWKSSLPNRSAIARGMAGNA